MKITFINSLDDIDAMRWNLLCPDDYPFARYEFLAALEQSGSVNIKTGWQPQHLLVEEQGKLIAALPLYLKSHSYGEYVFDWAWADAYDRYGLDYYPKLVSAIPFTPCAGPRLLTSGDELRQKLVHPVCEAIQDHAKHVGASGWHCLFPTSDFSRQLVAEGISQRVGTQFHWFNRGYDTWTDFVNTMNSRKRKNINKERRAVVEQGIYFVSKTGGEIDQTDWDLFFQLYRNTYLKRSGHAGYLTKEFFILLGKHFVDHTLIVMAYHNEQPIAAALFFRDSKSIYGRYWGCLAEYDFLHFETCYYQGIEYAISNKLSYFNGGAQGEHKIQRGFEPVTTYSNHWLMRSDFQQAIDKFLHTEKSSIQAYIDSAKTHLPFKIDN